MGTQAKVRRTRTPGIQEIFNLLVESGIQKNFPNCGIVESRIPDFEILNTQLNTAQGIRNPRTIGIQNPSSTHTG